MISNEEQAFRLARAIVSDVLLYNQEKFKKGIENDNVFETMQNEINEGRKLFEGKVDASIAQKIFDKALVDVLFKSAGRFASKIW